MARDISLIGAPTDIGAGSRGASMGPEALRVAGIHHVLQSHGLEVRDTGNLSGPSNPWQPPVNGYRHLPEVTAWNRSLHDAVYAELQDGRLPIVLGGDHCLGIGSISAVARHCRDTGKKLRVLWQSEPLYDLALMASRNVPEKDLRAVSKAFADMGKDVQGVKILAASGNLVGLLPTARFVPSNGSEYSSYRNFYKTAPPNLR